MKSFQFLIAPLILLSINVSAQSLTVFDINKPVFKLGAEQAANTNRFLRFSALTGYREGAASTKDGLIKFTPVNDREAGTRRVSMINVSIEDLLTFGIYDKEQVILEVKDPLKYRYDAAAGYEQDWQRKNSYCFEYLLPASIFDAFVGMDALTAIRNEVAEMLGVKWKLEKRTISGTQKDYFIITEH